MGRKQGLPLFVLFKLCYNDQVILGKEGDFGGKTAIAFAAFRKILPDSGEAIDGEGELIKTIGPTSLRLKASDNP